MSSETFLKAFIPHATELDSSLQSSKIGDYGWIDDLNTISFSSQQPSGTESFLLNCIACSKSENTEVEVSYACKHGSCYCRADVRKDCTLKGKREIETDLSCVDIKCFKNCTVHELDIASSLLPANKKSSSSDSDCAVVNPESDVTVLLCSEVKKDSADEKFEFCSGNCFVSEDKSYVVASCDRLPRDSGSLDGSSKCHHESETDDSCGSAQDYCVECCDVVFKDGIEYRAYGGEHHLKEIMELVGRDLSEPYSIYTYRYFVYNWPHLCIRAMDVERCVGTIVCKMHVYRDSVIRGYIAMLAVDKEYRRRGIGTQLVLFAIKAMIDDDCDEILLEAETDNLAALSLYENLGFIREKRLHRYYLNGRDAFQLQLLLD